MGVRKTIGEVKTGLENYISGMATGDSITIVSDTGEPVALIIPVRKDAEKKTTYNADEWVREWNKLTEEIDKNWIGPQSAADALSEMRR